MKDKKKLLIGGLCLLLVVMAVGYALLSQQLSVNGTANITSNWQVEITNIIEKEKSTGATTNSTSKTATTASFNTSLTQPGDYALYEVTVTNKGTLDAVLAAKPTVTTGNNEAIQYELEGIAKGDKILKNNQTDTFTIKVQYNSSVTSQPSVLTSDIEVTLNYEQDLGQVVVYDEYQIGDVVEFNNANWRVIENSTDEDDYVTVMKERVLTKVELGSYAIIDNGTTYNTMPYYFSSTCHGNYRVNGITYNSWDVSGCANHNDYAGSKVKEFLEGTYIITIGENNLKEVNEYKIRLITLRELQQNLGCNGYDCSSSPYASWVYQNFGERQNNVNAYWTMTPNANNSFYEITMDSCGETLNSYVNSVVSGVRPVINLLKSAIE